MKTLSIIFLGFAILLLSLSFVYAHETQTRDYQYETMRGSFVDMDEMHEIMIQQFEPNIQDQMNVMHSFCQGG